MCSLASLTCAYCNIEFGSAFSCPAFSIPANLVPHFSGPALTSFDLFGSFFFRSSIFHQSKLHCFISKVCYFSHVGLPRVLEYSSTTRVVNYSSSFFYYSSTRNFLLPVTISTSVHLFLVIFGFCEVLMGTSDAPYTAKLTQINA